jgi:hypothetical protein
MLPLPQTWELKTKVLLRIPEQERNLLITKVFLIRADKPGEETHDEHSEHTADGPS